VSGERQTNEKKWRRFRKEFSIPSHSDTSSVGAKFEAGILYIKLPKLIKNLNVQTPTPTKPTLQAVAETGVARLGGPPQNQ
jgi:HSP20 family molecular chaperone IbpA